MKKGNDPEEKKKTPLKASSEATADESGKKAKPKKDKD